jgi:hypothetical protein
MKKLVTLFFAIAMMFSLVFISEAISSDNPFSVKAQQTVRVKRKKGIIRKSYGGGKYVVRKTWDGTKYVSKKVWVGTKYTGKKVGQGASYVGKKTWKGGRKVVSRSKKIIY